jgi:hypothetical protein
LYSIKPILWFSRSYVGPAYQSAYQVDSGGAMIHVFQIQADANVRKPFTAGFCVDAKETVWKAAPIIRWMEDKPLSFIREYCKRREWKLIKTQS